jgi:hypothetical protein
MTTLDVPLSSGMTPHPAGSLAALNRLSRERAWTADFINWSARVDHGRPWTPEEISPFRFAPSFPDLSPAQRLRCNQLQALALVEKLIWFERQLVAIARRLLGGPALLPALGEALAHFVAEEEKHTTLFWRLLSASEPDWYRTHRLRLFAVTPLQRFVMARLAEHPGLTPAWVWLAIFVEERALILARAYRWSERHAPGRLDPLHSQVHLLHFRDEAGHSQLGPHLLAAFYDRQPGWQQAFAGWLLQRLVASYVRPGATTGNVVRQLGVEFPALREETVPSLLDELADLPANADYRRSLFGATVMPRTLALLAAYPEHQRLARWLRDGGEDRP